MARRAQLGPSSPASCRRKEVIAMSRILAVPLAALLVTACEKTPVEAPRTPPVAQKPVRRPR